METTKEDKLSKVRVNSVMIRQETSDHLQMLADQLGKNSVAGMAADLLEASSQIKPINYHIALAEFIKHGRK